LKRTNPFSLENKTILITGASSGIGRQCTISCAEMGANVIITGRNKERLSETASKIPKSKFGGQHILLIDQEDSVLALIQDLKEKGIVLNGFINAAGISTTLPVKFSTMEKQLEFYATNIAGPLNLTRLLLKKGNPLVDKSSVVFISSVMAIVGEKAKTLYSGSKGALNAVSRSLALEVANRSIRVNTVSPGVVVTPMSQNAAYAQDEDSLQKTISKHPMGLGHPDDVANACIYLLSDASKWVTGSNLVVDGGYTAQ
jgi:NAD(P)-dependent dehydrogenase (short-subunit alcohol dehydrogenase family)